MNPKQLLWLADAAKLIPGLFAELKQGDDIAAATLGERVINVRLVRLYLQVVGSISTLRNLIKEEE